MQASKQLTLWNGTSLALLGTLRYMLRYRDRLWFPNDKASSAGLKPALLGASRLAPAFKQDRKFPATEWATGNGKSYGQTRNETVASAPPWGVD